MSVKADENNMQVPCFQQELVFMRDVMPVPRLKEPQAVPCLQGALEVPLSPTHASDIGHLPGKRGRI